MDIHNKSQVGEAIALHNNNAVKMELWEGDQQTTYDYRLFYVRQQKILDII